MTPFRGFQFAMMGSAVNEMQHADRDEYISQLEKHCRDLEDYGGTAHEEYQTLRSTYVQLQNYAQSVQAERDELRDQMLTINEHFEKVHGEFLRLNEQFQRFRAETERWAESAARKLQHYESMKKIFRALLDHGERFFTNEVTAEHRESLRRFLAELPD